LAIPFLFTGTTRPAGAAGLGTELVASGLDFPVYAASPPGDPRLFIVEQRGVIKVLEHGQVLQTPFLDIDPLVFPVSEFDERGLLGLAFHPKYDINGFFYVKYNDNDWRTVIARYQVSAGNPNLADSASAFVILTIDQPAPNHKGGTLNFGPRDGYLYIGMGDGGNEGDPSNYAQRDDSLLGKMLRIDVDGDAPYAIPLSNPHAEPGLPLDEIWARGFRNPYRWSFDRKTGDLYIGDVGQALWEEVDFQPAASAGGENYGWRLMEASHCYNPTDQCNPGYLVLPIHEYRHIFHCAVVGGYVYRGEAIPALSGSYFFGDFCTAAIWSFRFVNGMISEFTDRTAELSAGGEVAWISGFAEDSAGEIYIVDRGLAEGQGELWKIVPDGTTTGVSASETSSLALRLSTATPNPFSIKTRIDLEPGSDRSRLNAAVYSPAGRLVRELSWAPGLQGSGSAALEWDGRDARGVDCPSGMYLLRVSGDGQDARERLVLLR
jgi:glucose/arabinose dehydrogenase